ncbi:MAG: uracil-DNA glycosylase [Verrucomicrobia bacterium]|nr:uracil-DNA glycosylase [Verrucomicrobiota bacterium]
MRQSLQILTDELRRLKTEGVGVVAVSDEALAALRRVVAGRQERSRQTPPAVAPFPGNVRAPVEGALPAYTPPAASAPAAPVLPTAPVAKLPASPVVPPLAGDKRTRWDALLAQVTGDLTCQANVRPGKKVVLGVGSLDAAIMFVGEAPGAEEEIQGEPFVGPAGQLLTKMIQGMGLRREDVYIGNIMNWRPQMPTVAGREQVGNRPPTEEEMRYCLPYLLAQIEIVDPAVLVALGSTAAQGLLGFRSFKTLGEVRGRWHNFAGKPLMITYHPSYILREPTNRKKRLIWEDLLQVMERVALPISDRQRAYFLER